MPEFTVDVGLLRHALLGRSLSQVGDSLLQAKVTSPVKVSGLTFTPSASLAVRVLNHPDDKDDHVHVPKATQAAWLKYTLNVKAEAKVAFAPVAAGSARNFMLCDYRRHDATDSAWRALEDDLESPRTLLEPADVRKLGPGEVLVMELGGALTAAVAFSWSDLLATSLPDILGERWPITVKLKSGLEARTSVKVTDQFSVAVSRTSQGQFRFAVRKATARNRSYGIELGYGADVTAIEGIDDVLAAIFENAPEQAGRLRDEIRKRLVRAVTWKAAAGFAYEYARLEDNETIAEFILRDAAQLEHDHALVLAGDFAAIADLLRRDQGSRELVRYLGEKSLVRRSSSGFSLGLGRWAVKAEEESVFRQSTRTSIDGFRLVTCRGTRTYEEKNVPRNDFEWTVDFKAQMKEFLEHPSSADFEYGLHLLVTLERASLDQAGLERMLDLASMWDVCLPDAGAFGEAIGRKASVRAQLLFDHDALAAIASRRNELESWASPLAMAMPYASRLQERSTWQGRRDTYSRAWRAWLDGRPNVVGARSGVPIFERRARPGSFAWVTGEGHPQLRLRLTAFARGMRRLHEVMTSAHPPEEIGTAYESLQQFWAQRLYVLAVGRWLLDRAHDAGVAARATLQVEYADETITA